MGNYFPLSFSDEMLQFIICNSPEQNNINANYQEIYGELNFSIEVIGNGPLSQDEMSKFIFDFKGYKIRPSSDSLNTKLVIFGSDAIGEYSSRIRDLFEKRKSRGLYVYSQEMILTRLLFGIPSRRYIDNINLIEHNLTIVWLLGVWPSFVRMNVIPHNIQYPKGISDWESDGPLGRFGYHVGKTGISDARLRSKILMNFLNEDNKNLDIIDQDWGKAGSKRRLLKMAETIVMLYNRTRGHTSDYSIARSHWEEDLNFLRVNVFSSQFRGALQDWPQFELGGWF